MASVYQLNEIQDALKIDCGQMARSATQAATKANGIAISAIRHPPSATDAQGPHGPQAMPAERRGDSLAVLWWTASMLTTGALLGMLAMVWITDRSDVG